MCYLCIAFRPYPHEFCQKVTDFNNIWFECHVALPPIIPTSELPDLF